MKPGSLAITLLLLSNAVAALGQEFSVLPVLPSEDVLSRQFSSHSPHQRNGDVYNYLYQDVNGDAVIFDAEGPGCLKSIWGTVLDEKAEVLFYFDGNSEPQIRCGLVDLFRGTVPGFPSDKVSYDRRGYYVEDALAANSFVNIPFEKSLRIAVHGTPTFYHIMYETYPYGTRPAPDNYMSGSSRKIHVTSESLAPWQSFEILKVPDTGVVTDLTLELPDNPELLCNLRLKMLWDNTEDAGGNDGRLAYEMVAGNRQPNVDAPLGFFFLNPYRLADIETSMFRTYRKDGKVILTCRLPMPFWRNASIWIENRSSVPCGEIVSDVTVSDNALDPSMAGYFNTTYREGKTVPGKDWEYVSLHGAGKFIGVVQSSVGGHYCEGNEHFCIDGSMTPQINGTGTEDYFLGCFWPNRIYVTDYAGCMNDVRIDGGGDPERFLVCLPEDYLNPAVYYRLHLDMPIVFKSSFDGRIEHGAENNTISDYASLAFYYLNDNAALVETDALDFSSPAAVKMHSYKAKGKYRTLSASYEGDSWKSRFSYRGHDVSKGGKIVFTMAVAPDNNGVRLMRRTDQAYGRQKVDVYVDGRFAGVWSDPQKNEVLRWYDSQFSIAPALVTGKDRIKVELRVTGESFNSFGYHCYTITR